MPQTTIRLQQLREDIISDEVREIVSYRPNWMVRHGSFVFFMVLLSIVLLTVFIQYPDQVKGSARIVALNAPKTSVARSQGTITGIFVKSGERVSAGQRLALLENTADYREVVQLQAWLQKEVAAVNAGNVDHLTNINPVHLANLGDLQDPYQSFVHEWNELRQFFGNGYYQKKKFALQRDLLFTAEIKKNIGRQEELSRQEKHLQETEFIAYDSLAKERFVAPIELNKYRTALLQKDQNLAQTEAQIINSDMSAHNKQKELLDMQKAVADQHQKFMTALLLLKSEIEKWNQRYVLTAPETGTVFLLSPIQPGMQVSNGEELFYVQPAVTTYYAQLMAGQAGLGKIKEGQRVRLKVDNYPSEQYGNLKGIVTSISSFPNRRDSFLVQVRLPEGLTTSYRKDLFFRNNMLASAEIITDNRKLFDRFFDPLRTLWNQ
ncbi:HlyD family efflux transporter periplasmic adaptor subunit [Flaviaesturariibacter flavus]|uniref:HlyD family efflux transporter periplasmic adaptor subunit n=1 Tax=Flaviaesturariibacter flavus TaxID=2502780 RepID=A0A4R1BPN8_9BACT|nr:HlyD family efflux transporter periplasmic adaptor subunit [Flaviaesturariibacter flavus]TCJ19599.1 HlyD family efflux transporter periplasmic adaptor subunit [Flaviaesturariibacter flavus]